MNREVVEMCVVVDPMLPTSLYHCHSIMHPSENPISAVIFNLLQCLGLWA